MEKKLRLRFGTLPVKRGLGLLLPLTIEVLSVLSLFMISVAVLLLIVSVDGLMSLKVSFSFFFFCEFDDCPFFVGSKVFSGVKGLVFWLVVVRSEVGMMDFSTRLKLEESYKLISFRKVTKDGCFLARNLLPYLYIVLFFVWVFIVAYFMDGIGMT